MDLLVIGGTRFLGRHLVAQALAQGHRVTLLHRGRSMPAGLFPQAEHLIADRDGDLAVLDGKRAWDTAIDTSAYVPRQVRSLAAKLRGRIGQYQLISTISVYASMQGASTDEAAALAELADPAVEQVTGETYGGLKVLCERAAAEAFAAGGTPCLIARPGLLVGPFDPTGRFTWWVQRLMRDGGDGREGRDGPMLAPGDPKQPVQCIDARDATAWLLAQAVARRDGIYNLTGPLAPLSFGALLAEARAALACDATFEWVDEAFLLAQNVAPWTDLPLWLPHDQAGLHRADIRRAIGTGLVCRALADTVRDTAAWLSEPAAPARAAASVTAAAGAAPPRPPVGLAPEREQQLLRDWRATGRH